jgi:hypothetical protein
MSTATASLGVHGERASSYASASEIMIARAVVLAKRQPQAVGYTRVLDRGEVELDSVSVLMGI